MASESWAVPFVLEDGKELCTLNMTSIPSEGPTFVNADDGISYKIIKVEGDRKKKDFKVTVRPATKEELE